MSNKKFVFADKLLKGFSKKSEAVTNPYVLGAEGRREWNDRYQNMAKEAWNWKKAFFGSLALSAVLAIGLVHVASQSKIQPFAVEVNDGMPIAIKAMQPMEASQQNALIYYAMTQFVVNSRTILSDTDGEKKLLDKVYAYSANSTIDYMHAYFEKNNPFDVAAQYTVSVNIVNAMPISKDTWQITWDETKRSAAGSILGVTRWEANATYKFGDVNPRFMMDNPWGLYVTQISWSQVQNQTA